MAIINYKAVRRSLKSLRSQVGSAMVGFIQSGTGATVRRLQDKNRDIYSVKDFGAVGDGSTDDTAAIQAACDYAEAQADLDAGHPWVAFPPGVYKVTSTITLQRNMKLLGFGYPIIKAFHNGDVIQAIGIPSGGGFPDNKVIFEGLSFKNDSGYTPSSFIRLGTADGESPTYIESVADAEINSCSFQNCEATYVIDNNRGFGLSLTKNLFTVCTCTAVLKMRQSTSEDPYWTYSVNLFSNDFTNITGKAIEADGGDLAVFGGIIEGCTVGAVEVGVETAYTGSQPVSFHGTYFEANTGYHFKSNNGRLVANFTGCKFVGGGATGNKLLFTSANVAHFYNCSTPNGAPTITGGNVRFFGCNYMAQSVGTVDSVRSDKAIVSTADPATASSFGSLLNVNGGLGGGTALIACSHSTGGAGASVSELFMIRMGVNSNNYTATSVLRIAGTDTSTFSFAVDASGYLEVTSSAAGNAKYDIVYQSNGVYYPG